jgi:hypothetical protein
MSFLCPAFFFFFKHNLINLFEHIYDDSYSKIFVY